MQWNCKQFYAKKFKIGLNIFQKVENIQVFKFQICKRHKIEVPTPLTTEIRTGILDGSSKILLDYLQRENISTEKINENLVSEKSAKLLDFEIDIFYHCFFRR